VNIEQLPGGRYRLRWYVAGRGSPRRQKTFPRGTRKKQVEAFAAYLEIRRAMGELALDEQRKRPLRDLSKEWWAKHAVPNLAEWTRIGYKRMLVKHIEPRLGSLPVGEINPEIVADFRAKLEAAGVGRHSVRQSLVVLQAMYEQAIRWGWVATNPVKAVKKPAAKRERAVVCLAPSQVEAIRAELLAREKLYAATMVSIIAYQGLRAPEELLALEVRHVRRNTLLVEQRNIDGKIIGGQKVRGFHPRAIDCSIQSAATCVNTCSLTESAKGCSSRAETASPGGCTTTRTGADGHGIRREPRLGSRACRPMTCGTLSPRFRSEPACRSRSSPSRWATHPR
jgi:hypothetical protein